ILVEQAQREGCEAVAVPGGELIPAGGALEVLRHAQPLRIEFGNQRLGGGVALFGAGQGQGQGGEEIAALEGAEGIIGLLAWPENLAADRLGIVLRLRQGRQRQAEQGGGQKRGGADHAGSPRARAKAARAAAGFSARQIASPRPTNSAVLARAC